MSYSWRDVPDSIGALDDKVNRFIVAKWDKSPAQEPCLSIGVWSSVFGKCGSVSLEVDGEQRRHLLHINVDDNRDVKEVRELLEFLIEEWNEEPRANYENLIDNARGSVLNHVRRQLAQYTNELAKYEAGDWS